MGKVGNALKMFQLLRNGKKYSIKELSDILEVSPRMIRIYKDELELLRKSMTNFVKNGQRKKKNMKQNYLELAKQIKSIILQPHTY